MSKEVLEAATNELKAAGVAYMVQDTKNHVHIHFGPNLQHLHVVAKSASDWRAAKNERASIRRQLKELGYVEGEIEPVPLLRPTINFSDGEPRCTSVDIASHFGRAHKDVLRAIDNVREQCGSEFDQRNFAPIEYMDRKRRVYRAYEMNKDGFSLVVMGFTGAKATRWKVAYIQAFNRMHKALEAANPSEALSDLRSDLNAVVDMMAAIEDRSLNGSRQPAYIPGRQIARIQARKQARRLNG